MAYSMSDLLQLVVSENAADLHLRVGTSPVLRVHGVLHRVEGPMRLPVLGCELFFFLPGPRARPGSPSEQQ